MKGGLKRRCCPFCGLDRLTIIVGIEGYGSLCAARIDLGVHNRRGVRHLKQSGGHATLRQGFDYVIGVPPNIGAVACNVRNGEELYE